MAGSNNQSCDTCDSPVPDEALAVPLDLSPVHTHPVNSLPSELLKSIVSSSASTCPSFTKGLKMRQTERQRKERVRVEITLIQKQQAGGENMHCANVISTLSSKCQFTASDSKVQRGLSCVDVK